MVALLQFFVKSCGFGQKGSEEAVNAQREILERDGQDHCYLDAVRR